MRIPASQAAAITVWLLMWPAKGQTPSEFRDYRIVSEVKLVLLDVAVRDSEGAFSSGLLRENFHVFDNGKEQPIANFSGEDTPVTVGILIDHSGSMRTKRTEVVKAALALIRGSNPKDEIFVVSFGDRVTFDLPEDVSFTDDQGLLITALGRQPPLGRTALYDAISAGLAHLPQGSRDRKTLVLISDGGDTASRLTAPEVIQLCKSSGATIHVLGIYDDEEAERDLRFLTRLATITGGELVIERDKTDLVAACRKIARDIRSRYTLGFHPPDSAGAQTRKVRVTVDAPGRGKLSARTREYYVIPPGEKTP